MGIEIFLNKAINLIIKRENREITKMREEGSLIYLSELTPYFDKKKIFGFANGGSVSNLKDISRLQNKNLMAVHDGPFHLYDQYGVMPNLWYLHYAPSAQVVLDHEKNKPLDFSDTFILVPSNDSKSVVSFSSPIVKKFRKMHPEATYVLYREVRNSNIIERLPRTYLDRGVEPLRSLGTSTLHNVSSLYFSGVDNLPTGHFYDRNRPYQTINGQLLSFPDKDLSLKLDVETRKICPDKGLDVYRLEKEETLFMGHVYKDFEQALSEADQRVSTKVFRNKESA
jgi:hypothetical protein